MPQWIRDTVLFLAGIIGILYEARRDVDPRFWLLVLYASMVGLPAFLGAAESAIGIVDRLRGKPAPAPVQDDPPSLNLRMACP